MPEWRNKNGTRAGIVNAYYRGNAQWRAAMAQSGFKPNYANRVRCIALTRQSAKSEQCGHPALKGSQYCRMHAPILHAQRTKSAAKEAKRATRTPRAPDELRLHPAWLACAGQPVARRALVHAWLAREDDPTAWRRLVREAMEGGNQNGP